jgi:pimeloyl-ACP methyl ester carboxylesterase
MNKKVIYFAHGNGFPSLSYQKMLNELRNEFNVFFMDKIAHDIKYPITQNWTFLVDELIADIEKKAFTPVVALGHSMGGALCLMASVKRPDLFEAVITLDSFVVSKIKLKAIRWAKHVGLIERLTPAKKTKHRCNYWKTKEDVKNYFRSKSFFKYFDNDCFNDYIEYGMQEDDAGFCLAFEREREYQIYCTLPHQFSLFFRENKAMPWVLIYGENSCFMKKNNIRAARKQYHMQCVEMKGSHMFPLEYPIESATKIKEVIREIFQ